MKKKLMLGLLSMTMALFVVTSCDDDETEGGSQTITVSIDGASETYTSNGAFLSHEAIAVVNGDTTRGSTMAIQFLSGSNRLTLVYVFEDQSWNAPCVEEGNYEVVGFESGNMRQFFSTGVVNGGLIVNQSSNGILGTITSCDVSNKKFSGTFNFVGEDSDNNVDYNISGSFSDLSFTEI